MILAPEQTQRYYRIWWQLLRYVNAQKHLIPDLLSQPNDASMSGENAIKIRDVLWKDDALRERFIAENPAALPPADLEIAASWKHRVAGEFYILRHLKKYSIFLQSGSPRAYGVLGLFSPMDEVVGPRVPILVKGVLLPFEDKIIYDGLLNAYTIYFGPGIRADMKMWLRDAEEREGIITSLLRKKLAAAEAGSQASERNEKLIAEFRKALYMTGVSPKMVEQHAGNLQSFADNLLAQNPPRPLLETRTKDIEAYLNGLSAGDAKKNLTSFKRYARFLWDSARSDPDALYALQDFLKSYRHDR